MLNLFTSRPYELALNTIYLFFSYHGVHLLTTVNCLLSYQNDHYFEAKYDETYSVVPISFV